MIILKRVHLKKRAISVETPNSTRTRKELRVVRFRHIRAVEQTASSTGSLQSFLQVSSVHKDRVRRVYESRHPS